MRLSPTWTWGWVPREHEVESHVNMRLRPKFTWDSTSCSGWQRLTVCFWDVSNSVLSLSSELVSRLLAINFLPKLLLRHKNPHWVGWGLTAFDPIMRTRTLWAPGLGKAVNSFPVLEPHVAQPTKTVWMERISPGTFSLACSFSALLPSPSVCGWCLREVTDSPNTTKRPKPS